jgi:hypothetical protein
VCGDFEWKRIYEKCLLFVYTYTCIVVGEPIAREGKGGGGVPLIGLISAHFGECPGFLTLWLFLVLNACFEVRDSCFDFDGIVDHNFLFIKLLR